jgi:hypothetical protein
MTGLPWFIWVALAALQFAAAAAVWRAGCRRFSLAGLCIIPLAAAMIANIGVHLIAGFTGQRYAPNSETAEALRIVIAFTLAASLAVEAVPDHRRVILTATAMAGTLAVCGALASPKMVHLMTFSAVLVNLAAWFGLVGNRPFDTTKLLIAGGLGIQLAGWAFGRSLAEIHPAAAPAGTVFAVGSDFIGLFVWWHAFTRTAQQSMAEHSPIPPWLSRR